MDLTKKPKLTEKEVIEGIKKHFPRPKIELNYRSEFELLMVVILSAQTTDKKVNEISPILFAKYSTPKALANADLNDLQQIIKPLGFYRRKSQLIKTCTNALVEKFQERIPDTIEALTQLPGVGRKTASAILVNAFAKPAIVVDTHVIRISTQRLKLSTAKNPDQIETDLAKFFSRDHWIFISKALVLFGRYICTAKKPRCGGCALFKICPFECKNLK